jgi:nitroreductase
MDILNAVKERRSIREFQKKDVPVGYPSKIPSPHPRVSTKEAVEVIE